MDLYFNELSAKSLSDDNVGMYLDCFLKVVDEAIGEGFHYVRFENGLSGVHIRYDYTLAQYCYSHSKTDEVKTLLSVWRQPFLEEIRQIDAFLEVRDFKVGGVSCEGLACAYLNESVGVGFSTPEWASLKYQLDIFKDGEATQKHSVLCLSSQCHFNDSLFVSWAKQKLPQPKLSKSKRIPLDKKIHLSDHHGKSVLMEFSSRLRMDPYIEEIVNSTDRSTVSDKFIVAMHDDLIEMRLVNQGGYGIIVRTTARNRRQLEAIARHLEEKFGQ